MGSFDPDFSTESLFSVRGNDVLPFRDNAFEIQSAVVLKQAGTIYECFFRRTGDSRASKPAAEVSINRSLKTAESRRLFI